MTKLQVVGYPRSGNNYLQGALEIGYGAPHRTRMKHSVIHLATGPSLVPLRNPADAIASHIAFVQWPTFTHEDFGAYYLRFHKAVRQMRTGSIVLLNFSKFTEDLTYLKTALQSSFGVFASPKLTDAKIKSHLISHGQSHGLPAARHYEQQREQVMAQKWFPECLDLYNELLESHGEWKNTK